MTKTIAEQVAADLERSERKRLGLRLADTIGCGGARLRLRNTKVAQLGYVRLVPGCWRIVNRECPIGREPSVVGPQYRTEAALLNDFDRYSKEYGY